MLKKHSSGFTIVELLIVIIVIGILAAISLVAYNGIQDKARISKMNSDILSLRKAAEAARINNSSNLISVTGSGGSGGNCWGKPDGTNLASLPDTDPCISSYNSALAAISTISGINVKNMRDPWGRPYLIDENEAEGSASNCTRDTIAAYRMPFLTGFGAHPSTPINNIPNSGTTGCPL